MSAVDIRDGVRRKDVPPDEGEFLAWLAGPTIVRIAGRDRSRLRGVGALLHGNEPSGLRAAHALLTAETEPAVDIACFFGAVEAALAEPPLSYRALPGRRDLNRCFGLLHDRACEDADRHIAEEALRYFEQARPEALVDLHNNTGHNPPYAITTNLGDPRVGLASLFVDRLIHTGLRLGSLMEAFAPELPVLTVECGRAGTAEADAFARDRLARYAAEGALPRPTSETRMHVFGDPMRVTLREGARIAFDERPHPDADLTLRDDVDRHNWMRLDAGTVIGWSLSRTTLPVEVYDARGRELAGDLFDLRGNMLVTTRPIIPVMMTTTAIAASSDCLFYVVKYLGELGQFGAPLS